MSPTRSFETLVLPWLDAGYNLARWLLHDEAAADDVLQDASLRAFRYLDSLRGEDARAWFLRIVRNACYTYLEGRHALNELSGLDEDEMTHLQVREGRTAPDPAEILSRRHEQARINVAIAALPPPLREVIVLRELEEMSYEDIAAVASIPIGTVMSRLSRARGRLRAALTPQGSNQESKGV